MTESAAVGPLRLVPRSVEKVWGGRALGHLFDLSLPAKVPVGEVWTAWDGLAIDNGPLTGSTLAQLARDRPSELYGRQPDEPNPPAFPLLVKFLDARENLSIQV